MSTPSYVCGTSSIPLIGDTIGAHFDWAVARWGSLDALVVRHQGIRWTYAELKERVDAVAAGLIAIGLAPGARVDHGVQRYAPILNQRIRRETQPESVLARG